MVSGDTKIIMINIWAFLLKFAVAFIIAVGLVFILFGNKAKASVLYTDNFENFTLNQLISGQGWTRFNNYSYVRNNYSTSPAQSLEQNNYGASTRTYSPSVSMGVISINTRITQGNETDGSNLARYYAYCGSTQCLHVAAYRSGTGIKFRHYYNRNSYIDYDGYQYNTWIKLSFAFNVSIEQNVFGINDYFFDNPNGLMVTAPNGNFERFTIAHENNTSYNVQVDDLIINNEPIWFGLNGNGSYDPDLIDWRSDINTVVNQNCMIGETCKLWFSYNTKAIGKKVYFMPDVDNRQNPGYAVSSTTIAYTSDWQNSIIIPSQGTATSSLFCLYLVDSTYGDLLSCGINVTWINPNIYDDYLAEFDDYNIASACLDVSTSTGAFWDDFRYGIECGIRKIIYWSFKPSKNSVAIFSKNIGSIQNKFPLNTYFSLLTDVENAISSTTLNKNGTLGIPFINASDVDNPEFIILPVLASTSISNAIGENNSNIFRMTIGWILWLFAVGFVIITVRAKH